MISAMVTPSSSARASMRWRCSCVRYTCVRVADIHHNIQHRWAQINSSRVRMSTLSNDAYQHMCVRVEVRGR